MLNSFFSFTFYYPIFKSSSPYVVPMVFITKQAVVSSLQTLIKEWTPSHTLYYPQTPLVNTKISNNINSVKC